MYKCITFSRPESILILSTDKRGHGSICLFVRNIIVAGVEVIDKVSSSVLCFKLGKISVIGDLNARTALASDQPVTCENPDKYVHCLEGAEVLMIAI